MLRKFRVVGPKSIRKSAPKTCTGNIVLVEINFSALFVINDDDRSGSMDEEEFLQTLESLGYPNVDIIYCNLWPSDHDMSGTIDAGEFAMIMVKEFCH